MNRLKVISVKNYFMSEFGVGDMIMGKNTITSLIEKLLVWIISP